MACVSWASSATNGRIRYQIPRSPSPTAGLPKLLPRWHRRPIVIFIVRPDIAGLALNKTGNRAIRAAVTIRPALKHIVLKDNVRRVIRVVAEGFPRGPAPVYAEPSPDVIAQKQIA